MIAAARTSKRTALIGALGAVTLFLCILAVKDMNDKLGVMTASNAGYQKMTDKQVQFTNLMMQLYLSVDFFII